MQFVQGGRSGHAAVNNPGHAKFIASGPLAATEQADAAVVAGTVASSGSLAATDAADVAALVGTTAAADAVGILATTEAADNSALAGDVVAAGTLVAIESVDTVALDGSGSIAGTLSSIEGADSFAGAAIVGDADSVFGVLAASEAADSAEVAGEITGEVVEPPIVSVGGGHYQPQRPLPVEGFGYAILPQIEGEAHGLVLVAGAGAALPRLSGVGIGAAGIDGRSAACLTAIKVAAVGDRGQAGAAVAVLDEGLSIAGAGVAGARGAGSGAIVGLKGAATGRYDDDEAAIMAWLLAA